MRHGSLFSGIGGFDLAAEWMGWTNVFHCEMDLFCNRVLKHHFPQSIGYENIKETTFSVHRGDIDILTGGFPCQPYSTAGKRLGKQDERHLWDYGVSVGFDRFLSPLRKGDVIQFSGKPIISSTNRGLSWEVFPSCCVILCIVDTKSPPFQFG